MNRDTLYNILYKDGKCNHESHIIDILTDMVLCHYHEQSINLTNLSIIDRWNIYGYDIIHIVFFIERTRKGARYNESHSITTPAKGFTERYRKYQLDKLVCDVV